MQSWKNLIFDLPQISLGFTCNFNYKNDSKSFWQGSPPFSLGEKSFSTCLKSHWVLHITRITKTTRTHSGTGPLISDLEKTDFFPPQISLGFTCNFNYKNDSKSLWQGSPLSVLEKADFSPALNFIGFYM